MDPFGIFYRRTMAPLLKRAEQEITTYDTKLATMRQRKEDLLKRQVELWGVLNLDPELEKEYKAVAAEIAYIAKALLVIEAYLKPLRLSRYICREQNRCDSLTLFVFSDPLKDLKGDTEKVPFWGSI